MCADFFFAVCCWFILSKRIVSNDSESNAPMKIRAERVGKLNSGTQWLHNVYMYKKLIVIYVLYRDSNDSQGRNREADIKKSD